MVIVICLVFLSCLSLDVLALDISRLPPELTLTPKREKIYKIGDKVEIQCEAFGIPTPQYIWKKDNKTLEIQGQYELNEGLLTINGANGYSNDGRYQCSAKNKFGVALSANVIVRQAQTKYSTRTEPITRQATQGELLQLDPDKIESFPGAVFKWKTVEDYLTNGKPRELKPSPRIALDETTGTLYFANIIPDDHQENRIYKLDVRNSIVDVTQGGSPFQIVVRPATVVEPKKPTVMAPGPGAQDYEYVGITGKNATLMCFFSGYPTPTITWEMPPVPPHQSRLDCTKDFSTSCNIRALEYSDEGVYTCTGANRVGDTSVRIHLKIESIPTFTQKPSSQNVSEGDSVTFHCKADAKPPAKVEWFTNGIFIDPQHPGSSRLIVDQNELKVTRVCKDCEGVPSTDLQVFQCRISNRHGEDYASAYLNVLSATKIYEWSPTDVVLDPTDESDQGMVTNFTCRAETDPLKQHELDIQWWHDQKRIYHEQGPYRLSEGDQVLEVNLKNLSTEDSKRTIGEYQCLAKTQYSNASKTFSLAIKGVTKAQTAMIEQIWWVFLIIFIILLLFIICICCVLHAQRNRGDEYPVDEKERLNGNDPEAEIEEMAFQDYQRPIESATLRKGSRASLGSTQHLDRSADEISMFTDPGRFDEDGSFVDNYGTGSRRQLIVPNHSVSEV